MKPITLCDLAASKNGVYLIFKLQKTETNSQVVGSNLDTFSLFFESLVS